MLFKYSSTICKDDADHSQVHLVNDMTPRILRSIVIFGKDFRVVFLMFPKLKRVVPLLSKEFKGVPICLFHVK